MSLVVILESIALVGWLSTGTAILLRWRKGLARHARPAFFAVACFSFLHSACMFLEWSGITSELEQVEDLLGATLPVWWAFAIYVVVEGMDRRDLRRSRERYALAQKAASIGSWDWNIASGAVRWSEEVEPMFGLEAGGFGQTHDAYLACVHPEDRAFVNQSMRIAVSEGAPFAVEHRIVWPDGTIHWISAAGDVLRDERGNAIRMLGIVNDITEQKRAQEGLIAQAETERLLLRELDHRVRNNLTSLVSVIGLSQAGAKSIGDFAKAVQNRTQAIASVHSILSAGKWRGSDLRTMLDSLIQPMNRTRIACKGPKVRIPLAQAQAVGLIINELATNSAKYGAMSDDGGLVRISWEVVAVSDGLHKVTLRWVESGGPPLNSPPRPGVGTSLVKGLAESELRGHAELTYPPEGASHTILMALQETGTAQFHQPAATDSKES